MLSFLGGRLACRAHLAVAVLIGMVTLPAALFGLAQLVATASAQLSEPAVETDFLNLYSGVYLFVHQPTATYDPAAQAALQQQLKNGQQSAYLPFLVAPHAALLLAPLGWLPYGVAYVTWLPAQQMLIMGQTSALALVRLGPDGAIGYARMAATKFQSTGAGTSTDYNVTILAATDWLLRDGLAATAVSAALVGSLWLMLILMWRRGLSRTSAGCSRWRCCRCWLF